MGEKFSKFLNVITFGAINRRAKKKAAAMAESKNNELTLNTVALPDVAALTSALGSGSNIVNVSATISTITFDVKDMNQVNMQLLQTISKKGVIKSPTAVNLLIGDCAM